MFLASSNDCKRVEKITIGIIGYGNLGKMLHSRLSRDAKFSFLIGSKEPSRNIDVVRKSDVVFVCLRHEHVAEFIKRIHDIPSLPPFFTTAPTPWPLELSTEQYLLLPSIYGLIGEGVHPLLGLERIRSHKANTVVERLSTIGKIEIASDFDSAFMRAVEYAIIPALLAFEALRMKTKVQLLGTKSLNRISTVSKIPVERIRSQLPLMGELVSFFDGDLQKIIDFVATKGGKTEKMIRELSQ